jgi:hypothetical protein
MTESDLRVLCKSGDVTRGDSARFCGRSDFTAFNFH